MVDLKIRLEEIKKSNIRTYKVIDLALDTARSDDELQVQGSYLYALSYDGANFDVRLNHVTNDKIPLRAHRGISGIFHTIFITHTAQAGKIAKLLIGVKEEFLIEDWS